MNTHEQQSSVFCIDDLPPYNSALFQKDDSKVNNNQIYSLSVEELPDYESQMLKINQAKNLSSHVYNIETNEPSSSEELNNSNNPNNIERLT